MKTLISFVAAACLTACSSFGEVTFNKQEQVKKREYDKICSNWKRDKQEYKGSCVEGPIRITSIE